MQVLSVETLTGLKRKVRVSIAAEEIQSEINSRLRQLKQKITLHGFRPGKVPDSMIKTRYADSVRFEVFRDSVEKSLPMALEETKLSPIGYPNVGTEQVEADKDFIYTLEFDIFPEFQVQTPSPDAVIEKTTAKVTKADVDNVIEKLREQQKDWQAVDRAVQEGDKVKIDFKGSIDNQPFEGGTAEDYDLVIGSGMMIPGFESKIVGAKKGEPFDIQVRFPEDYSHNALAGKEAVFNIKVKEIEEGSLPPLNEEFAQRYAVKEGGLEAFKNEIKDSMERELEKKLGIMNREAIFSQFLAINPIDLPETLVEKEIEQLNHEMYHRIMGNEHHDNEKIPKFPRELFEDKAKRQVHLGLLLAEYIKQHKIVVDEKRVHAKIDQLIAAYTDPDLMRRLYTAKERRLEIEAVVMEEMVAEKLGESIKFSEVSKTYEEIMNPKPAKPKEEKGV